MAGFLFCTADGAGAGMDQAGLLHPGRPGVTGGEKLDHIACAAALASGRTVAVTGAGGRDLAPFLQIVTRCGDGFGLAFSSL